MYDDIDMDHNFNVGFWVGAVAGCFGMLGLCLIVGYYIP